MRLDRFAPLLMVLAFLLNLLVCFLDPTEFRGTRALGQVVFLLGFLLMVYVAYYLRGGFLGEVEPNLDHLVIAGPYRWCRHPLYLSFVVIVLGIDLMLGSPFGIVVTLFLALPSTIYRAGWRRKPWPTASVRSGKPIRRERGSRGGITVEKVCMEGVEKFYHHYPPVAAMVTAFCLRMWYTVYAARLSPTPANPRHA